MHKDTQIECLYNNNLAFFLFLSLRVDSQSLIIVKRSIAKRFYYCRKFRFYIISINCSGVSPVNFATNSIGIFC